MELNEHTSKHNYYTFLWHAVFLALAKNFMDVDTIIPAMMVDAGSSAFQVGVLLEITSIECKYAFDYIERDWKQILANYDFNGFEEFLFFKNYVRLLKAQKIDTNKENSIRIAVPTNDGINIFPKMLGMAKEMFIYEIENGDQFKLIEKRNNPFANTMQHLKTLDVYELLDDCSIVISTLIGKKGIARLQERGMKLIFKKGKIEQALVEVSINQESKK